MFSNGIVQLDLLGDGHAVVRDQRGAEFLVENNVAALGPERDLHGVGKLVNAGLQSLAGVLAINQICLAIIIFVHPGNYSTIARMSL